MNSTKIIPDNFPYRNFVIICNTREESKVATRVQEELVGKGVNITSDICACRISLDYKEKYGYATLPHRYTIVKGIPTRYTEVNAILTFKEFTDLINVNKELQYELY